MKAPRSLKAVEKPVLPKPELAFDPRRSALVIIDMQYGDASRHHGLGKILATRRPDLAEYYFDRIETVVVPNHLKLLDLFRKNSLTVVLVVAGARLPDLSDLPPFWRRTAFLPEKELGIPGARVWFHSGEFEFSILKELGPTGGDVIQKSTSGAFNSSPLDVILCNKGVETVVFTGVATDGCVLATVIDAADLGYTCIVVEDACATREQANHDAILRILGASRAWVMTTAD